MRIGYAAGVFDLFHAGHVRLLRNAKALCDKLIVGVTVDELVSYKGKSCVIGFEQRVEVVASCRYVDVVVPQYNLDKADAARKYKASVIFVGDDWYGTERWEEYERILSSIGCSVMYFPYTRNISSTLINEILENLRGG